MRQWPQRYTPESYLWRIETYNDPIAAFEGFIHARAPSDRSGPKLIWAPNYER